ncbi:response regulator transcription factor [Aquibacillus albus]|uniref:YesN/AraC family two-component response regulator n=1 Tax=Aquibacillus albus TaxID=1168171 RepID=A0ABS2MWQ0_9BACI|nr:response regulator [Aquibacillus albus]MBM7570286.1 YesN/AraC family two-component response regulator [Aquibacillus albus]
MHKRTILIVDDEERTRKGLTKTLTKWANEDYEILGASDGEEAIEIIEHQPISLLITDIRMPKITGLQLLQKMKEQLKNPVVIVISAYSEFDYAQQALRFGAINYLLKPLSKTKLIEAVENALEVNEKRERIGMIEKVMDKKLIEISGNEENVNKSVMEALKFVDNNYHQDIGLKDVADHVHLNPSYFSVLFKEEMNMTFSEYLKRTRIQHAKKLLITTNLTIIEIAEKVGYHTSKYFIKLFKEYEDITPSKYRRENKD